MNMQEKIRFILRAGGETQMQLAQRIGVSQSTVNRWLTGSEPEGANRDIINGLYQTLADEAPEGTLGTSEVPLMGFIGAGAEIEPEFEQTPPEGLDQIHIPFPLPHGLVAFQVRGDSMLPVYRDGTVIIVYSEQQKPLSSFYGEEAAVRTADGRRFLKTIRRGTGDTVSLYSWNADAIEDVRLEWIGEIFATLPASSLRRVGKQGGVQGQLKLRA